MSYWSRLAQHLPFFRCRRFCVGQSIRVQQRLTTDEPPAATRSTSITCELHNSIEFNKRWNLVRDQGVGGSNPLSPTNCFQAHKRYFWFSAYIDGDEIV